MLVADPVRPGYDASAMRTKLFLIGLVGASLSWLCACGAKVVVDAEGSGGAGGTTSVDPQALCATACDKLAQTPGCGDEGCVADCQAEYQSAAECQDEFVAAAECMIKNAGLEGQCFGSVCDSVIEKYEVCQDAGMGCSGGTCIDGQEGFCECSSTCNGVTLTSSCVALQLGGSDCACVVNGEKIASCESSGVSPACDLQFGCCAAFFP